MHLHIQPALIAEWVELQIGQVVDSLAGQTVTESLLQSGGLDFPFAWFWVVIRAQGMLPGLETHWSTQVAAGVGYEG